MSKVFLLPAKLGRLVARYVPGCTIEKDGHLIVSYEIAYRAVNAAYKLIGHKLHTNGTDQIQQGPGWVIAKHSSGMDITDISSELRRVTGKKPYFVGRNTLVKSPWDYAQYDEFGAKFINRDRPSAESMNRIVETVNDGNLMVIFPEGTRTKGKMGKFNPGAAMLAYMLLQKYDLDAPIYCMGIRRGRNKADIRIAPPMRVGDFGGIAEKRREKKKRIVEMTDAMHECVGELSGFGKKNTGNDSLERIIGQQSGLALSVLSDSLIKSFYGI